MSPGEFLKEFGHLAETEGGIERLRTLVLAQAFQGHLGGAEAPRKRLIDVSEIEMGNSPPGTSYNDAGNGVPLINGPVEFSPGPFGETRRTKFTTEPTRMCKTGDILICVRGATTGRTNIAAFDACIGRGVASIRPTGEPRYVHWFLVYSAKRLLAAGTGTTFPAISRDQIDTLELPIPPLPEQKRIVEKVDQLMALCDELEAKQKQKRTKAVVLNKAALSAVVHAPSKSQLKGAWSRVQDHFEVLYELPENVKELRQTILQLAVMGKLVRQEAGDGDVDEMLLLSTGRAGKTSARGTSPIEPPPKPNLPSGWGWVPIKAVTVLVTDGEHQTPSRVASGVPLATAKNVRDGFLDLSNTDFVSRDTAEKCRRRCSPTDGDVLMVCVGATTGRLTVLVEPPEMVLVRSVALLRPDTSKVSAGYLGLLLNSPLGQQQIWAGVKRSAQPCLYLSRIDEIMATVPPVREQRRILSKVDQLVSFCDELEAKLAQHRDQGQRLMQAVVEGLVA